MNRVIVAALLLPVAGCVEHHIAQGEVKSALVKAGLPHATSKCIAHRMVTHLSVTQLRKLKALQGPKRSVDDYLAAVDRVNDPAAIRAAIASAGLCGKAELDSTD